MKTITFPDKEKEEIKKRINLGKNIFTLRFSKEQGKYKKDELLKTEWNNILKVHNLIEAEGIDDLKKKYKHYEEAIKKHPEVAELIKKYKKVDIIELSPLN